MPACCSWRGAAACSASGACANCPLFCGPGDVVILNDSRVLPARLRARRPDGGSVELLLVRATTPDRWLALARPARRLRVGQTLTLAPPPDAASPPGAAPELTVAAVGTTGFVTLAGTDLAAVAEAWGELPLPPYIRRPGAIRTARQRRARDRERYQTVFARETGIGGRPDGRAPPRNGDAGRRCARAA